MHFLPLIYLIALQALSGAARSAEDLIRFSADPMRPHLGTRDSIIGAEELADGHYKSFLGALLGRQSPGPPIN